jgi:formiminoglutamase
MHTYEFSKINFLQKPQPDLWQGRNSEMKEYWHENVILSDNQNLIIENSFFKIGLLGYAVDEGISRNQGRIGAQNGPNEIKKMLGAMAYHLPHHVQVIDYGNVICLDNQLEVAHKITQAKVFDLLKTNHFPIILGGGHDLAFAHLSGIAQYLDQEPTSKRIGIINLDAHFDLRPLNEGKAHSGSPFSQWADYCHDKNVIFDYLCLGIQTAANPRSLFSKAVELGAYWLEMSDFQTKNWTKIEETLENFYRNIDCIYLTIDLDGFSSAYAPGVSASSPLGFSPEIIFETIEHIVASKKLISADIVELNPLFDQDNVTAKLAARLIEKLTRCISA